jgi:hypothetical protein
MMRSHAFDPLSAALGLIAVAIGAVVAFDGTDSVDTGWWLALGALVLGLGLVPWTRPRRPVESASAGDVEPHPSTIGATPRVCDSDRGAVIP